jgi:hypothetical protein
LVTASLWAWMACMTSRSSCGIVSWHEDWFITLAASLGWESECNELRCGDEWPLSCTRCILPSQTAVPSSERNYIVVFYIIQDLCPIWVCILPHQRYQTCQITISFSVRHTISKIISSLWTEIHQLHMVWNYYHKFQISLNMSLILSWCDQSF